MLSAESAAGQFPIEAVTTMDNVAREVESDPTYRQIIEASRTAERKSVADGIVAAAREIAETTEVKAICCFSESGTTAALVARERPRVPIVALTNLERTARRLCLTWGTSSVITASVEPVQGGRRGRDPRRRGAGRGNRERTRSSSPPACPSTRPIDQHPARRPLRRAADIFGRARIGPPSDGGRQRRGLPASDQDCRCVSLRLVLLRTRTGR